MDAAQNHSPFINPFLAPKSGSSPAEKAPGSDSGGTPFGRRATNPKPDFLPVGENGESPFAPSPFDSQSRPGFPPSGDIPMAPLAPSMPEGFEAPKPAFPEASNALNPVERAPNPFAPPQESPFSPTFGNTAEAQPDAQSAPGKPETSLDLENPASFTPPSFPQAEVEPIGRTGPRSSPENAGSDALPAAMGAQNPSPRPAANQPARKKTESPSACLITTTPEIAGRKVRDYLGLVSTHIAVPKDILLSNPAPQGPLNRLKAAEAQIQKVLEMASQELAGKAEAKGADAVIGVRVDFANFDAVVSLCSATGTAVTLD